MRRQSRLLAALVMALLGAAESAHAVELVQPSARAVLRGGSFASLQIALPAVSPVAEEWEAFLSLDGGAHYDLRITPHLDLSIDGYTWLVPNVDASDARILIRTGDERHEMVQEIPACFSIRRDARAAVAVRVWIAREKPEPARPGDQPVSFWTEGDRGGISAAPAVALPTGHSWTAVASRAASALSVAGPSRSSLPTAPRTDSLPFRAAASSLPGRSIAPPPLSILLTCRRLNI